MKETETYYSNGKLMLTGEYLVLHGATALVMPVRFGQSLTVLPPTQPGVIRWQAFDRGSQWLNISIETDTLKITDPPDQKVANQVSRLLKTALTFLDDPSFFTPGFDLRFDTNFNLLWGLGTSSTLISNIAYWLNIDPYALHNGVSRGSGFDIACARASSPMLFTIDTPLPDILPVHIPEAIRHHLYFIYLGKKEDSEAAVESFLIRPVPDKKMMDQITAISRSLPYSADPEEWKKKIILHEEILSNLLQKPTLKERLFPDFEGAVKSLGAWGGDFAMALWTGPAETLTDYFRKKGYPEVLPYHEMEYSPVTAGTEH